MNNPDSFSLSSQERCSTPQIIFVVLLWTHSNRPMSFQGSRAGLNTPGEISPEWRGRIPSLDLLAMLLLTQPGISWPSGLRVHIVGSCPAFHPPVPPSPSQQGCSQSLHPPACIDSGDCPHTDAGPCPWPYWTSRGSHRPSSWACPGPSGWHLIARACQLHHTAWCHLQTCWGYTQWNTKSLMKIFKSTGPSMDPWGTLLITDLHLDTEPLTTTLWMRPSNQFLIHWTVQPSNPYFPNLERRILWDTMSRALQKSG